MDTSTKVCSRCKLPKPISEFPHDKRAKNGLDHRCKQCNKERRLIPVQNPEQSFRTATKKLWSKVDKSGGDDACWLWTWKVNGKGYGALGCAGKVIGAHVLSWIIANGAIPDNLFVLHECDTPRCVNPKHLRLGTQTDNMTDCAKRGRHGHSKLSPGKVREIRRLWATGEFSQQAIANAFSVSQRTISLITLGRIWRHVDQ